MGDVGSVKAFVEAGADLDEAKDALHTCSHNYGDGGGIARYLLSVASPGLINKVKRTAPPQALARQIRQTPPQQLNQLNNN